MNTISNKEHVRVRQNTYKFNQVFIKNSSSSSSSSSMASSTLSTTNLVFTGQGISTTILAETGGFTINNNVSILSTTQSMSPTSGALVLNSFIRLHSV